MAEVISSRKRMAQVAASVFWCFTCSGVVFGYPALKPVLLQSGVYSDLCDEGIKSCSARDTRLNFLFTMATVITNGCALPAGSLLDKFGPRTTTMAGAIVFLLGNLLFGLQIVHKAFDTYLIGYSLIALGSVAMFLSQFHLSNAFPSSSGVVLAALTGAFDASSVPYLIYREVYFKSGGRPSLRTFFWLYTLLPVAIIIQQLLAGPTEIYVRSVSPDPFETLADDDDLDDLARARSPRRQVCCPGEYNPPQSADPVASGFSRLSYGMPMSLGGYADEDEIKEILDGGKGDRIVGAMFGKSLKEQLTSSWFWIICAFLFVSMLRTNLYLATVQSQLEFYTNDKLADTLTRAFCFLLPLAGIVGIPFVGMLLDTRPTIETSWILMCFGIGFGVLTMIPKTVPQLVGIAILTINRPLLYTYLSDIIAKVFGFANFGKVYGLAMTLSGAFGLLLSPMDLLTKDTFDGNYTPLNSAALLAGLASNLALTVKIWTHTRNSNGRIALPHDEY